MNLSLPINEDVIWHTTNKISLYLQKNKALTRKNIYS